MMNYDILLHLLYDELRYTTRLDYTFSIRWDLNTTTLALITRLDYATRWDLNTGL